jgi:hypothetical protein
MKTYEEAVTAFAEKITNRREWARNLKPGIYRSEVEYKNRVYTTEVCSFMVVIYGQGDPEFGTGKVLEDIIAICGYPNYGSG